MSEETDAGIVPQMVALATYAERANHWTDDMRLMDAAGVADTVYGAIERIEALEAKLIDAMYEVATYSNDPHLVKWARKSLSELKGDTDG